MSNTSTRAIRIFTPRQKCLYMRDVAYATDKRWGEMARDTAYMRMFPRERAW